MFKAIAAVLAFAAFLIFAPASRADAIPQGGSLVTVGWF